MRAVGALDDQGRRVAHDKSAGFKTVEQGAATNVWCAANAQLDGRGGVYCEDADIAVDDIAGFDRRRPGVVQWAVDPDIARRLWTLSEDMTGVKFE